MTSSEIESLKYKSLANIDEAFTSIKRNAEALKDPQDKDKNLQTMLKIQQFIADTRREYGVLEALAMEEPDPEDDEYGTAYTGSSYLGV